MKAMGGWMRQLQTVASLVGAVLAWELAVRIFKTPEYILPAPSKVLYDLFRNYAAVLPASYYTMQPMVLGFLVAVVLGVLLALLVVYSHLFERIFYPLLVVLQIIPKIAIAPLFIIWVGFGLPSKVLLVFLLSFFPIVVNSIVAFKSIESDVYDLAKSYRASRLKIFWRVELPSALPSLFAGFKVAAALSATAAVVAEFVASDNGLGYLLLNYNGNLNTSMTFAVILVLSLLGLILYGVVELIERWAIPWHVSQRRDDFTVGKSGV
ncbi:Hydroxymethylpyrimidine ABC transporter, transmembrane component [Hyphomicrobiales bacterium]|nr:Hydroxymethylpyrimidine ABC transporter, transmembrane component [Hyphomicrobiales bacterium]CAH1654785.1 Hydroxymethylpyrimidine ABC transporter, transmembrane component [Hyphomicrobiales bacterium]CAH1667140.1 Hydroxymethylpyrimidine ABC transporter, transmembrane component [Hyphomicrobiales bacterium]CAH1672080.1 Hydroxymethylpyrimidine ABC transporter, transmembrane component [Hyphomicrobiales bacterium]